MLSVLRYELDGLVLEKLVTLYLVMHLHFLYQGLQVVVVEVLAVQSKLMLMKQKKKAVPERSLLKVCKRSIQ